MPKLLQINVSANWGSHGRIAEEIGQFVMRQGWESYIAYGRYVNESKSCLIKIGNKNDIYNHVVKTRIFDNHGLSSIGATKKFLREISALNPDIIHLHNIHGYYINYELLLNFLKGFNKPVVWTFHDCWPFTGHCAYPVFADCEKWHTHCYAPCPMRREYPKSWVMDRCWKNYENKKTIFTTLKKLHIVTVSEWLEDELRKSFFADNDIRCIYNGIDVDVFRSGIDTSSLRLKHRFDRNDKIILGVASRWEDRKGLNDFYKLRGLLPGNYKIVLIGLTDRQIIELPKGIEGIERTDNQEQLATYYNMADVYVNSSYAETFGMTTAEALSCGTPSVVYNITACPEVLDNNTGYVVQPGDTNAMVEVIHKICEKSKDYYKSACRNRVIESFEKKLNYGKYFDLYQDLIRQEGGQF